jgi:hypothetical protein
MLYCVVRNRCKVVAHTFSHTIDLDHDTSGKICCFLVHRCWLLSVEKNEIYPIVKADFDKIDISILDFRARTRIFL